MKISIVVLVSFPTALVCGVFAGYFLAREDPAFVAVVEANSERVPPVRYPEWPAQLQHASPPGALEIEVARIARLGSRTQLLYEAERLFAALSAEQFPAALEALEAVEKHPVRRQLLAILFESWGATDPAGGISAVTALPAGERSAGERSLFVGWTRADPEAALLAARERTNSVRSSGWAIRGVVSVLAETDPARAFAEGDTATNQWHRFSLRMTALETAADHGSIGEIATATLRREQTWGATALEFEDALSQVFRLWSWQEPDAAMAVLGTIDDPNLSRSAMRGLLEGWAELDPVAAARFALENSSNAAVAASVGQTLQKSLINARQDEVEAIVAAMGGVELGDAERRQAVQTLTRVHPARALEVASEITEELPGDPAGGDTAGRGIPFGRAAAGGTPCL